MPKLKTIDIVNSIAQLGTQRVCDYPSGKAKIKLKEIKGPEGPIKFARWGSRESEANAKEGRISTNKIATAAAVFSRRPNYPIHFDRLFSGGGNERSALEALLAHTPHFFICSPQRTNPYTGNMEKELKHIMWCPNDEHLLGEIGRRNCDQVISEVELEVDFGEVGKIGVTPEMLGEEFKTIEAKTTHTQMQVALVEIGNALNFRTWIARNDHSIQVGESQLGRLKGVLQSLEEARILYTAESKDAASRIDCIWFSDDFKYIPAVIEVEHSTGVTSGMTRMLKFMKTIPSVTTNFTIVAPNNLRNKVVSEANNAAFQPLKARYMPYSTLQMLYGLIRKFSLSNLERNFIEPFMESIIGERT
jgi:type II restriction enzyme